MYFKKLKNGFNYTEFPQDEIFQFYGDKDKGVIYYNIDQKNSHLFNCIKEPYRKYFGMTSMKINMSTVPPHTDSNILVTINFYIRANNYKTTFYKISNPNYSTNKLETQTNGRVFNFEDLSEEVNFVANDNDIYVLDVTKPHSVINLSNRDDDRIAISIQSTVVSYKQTISILNNEFLK
jgi:hypothetical protein